MSHVQLPSDLPRRRITVDEWHQMIEAGVFGEDEHIELIEGEIVAMPPQGEEHGYPLQELADLLTRAVSRDYRVRVQLPLTFPRSEPEPDVAVVRAAEARAGLGHPHRALLVAEVARTSLKYDRETKVPLYATHGVPEVWVVDVGRRQVEVYTDPDPTGVYRSLRTLGVGEDLVPTQLPGVRIAVAALF